MPEDMNETVNPSSENSFAVSCILSFEDGTEPMPFKADEPDVYEFNNMKLHITMGDNTQEYQALVKKEFGKFVLGTMVLVPTGNIKEYAKVDKIIFSAKGYEDIEFVDMPINGNFVNLPAVVMKKQ